MKAQITLDINVQNSTETPQVKKAIETFLTNFGAQGIIQMEQLFLKDAFIRNLVKMKIKNT
ncbi:hypothetical protein [Aquimarina algiphila]|uniref:hypothetical protein n=1 Tax=Aquimarina algiphila TaxID=2047982 RepID=UPI00232D6872|nr:hypothetical protein [Aquimarina algiphila]